MIIIKKRKFNKKTYLNIFLSLILVTIFFNFGVKDANAVIKILSNSRHAFNSITSTVNTLLGSGHIGVDIIVHSTNLNSDYTSCCSPVFNTSATYYDETGAGVASQAPYQIYTSSFNTGLGDSLNQYNQYDGIDFMHNLAFTTSPNTIPPVFITAPGGNGWASLPGIEWTLDGSEFSIGTSLSALTASNAGMMTVIRHNNPTWNWFDVKAALRQTGTNWVTGYDSTDYGFGVVSYASSTALTDSEILLQPPTVSISTSSLGQLQFTVYPFKQTRRVKEVLFQFDSNPGFQADEMTLSEIITLGGTKVGEYTKTTAEIISPVFPAVIDKYYVWLTSDNSDDSLANFSRIEEYGVLGPLSQSEIDFSGSFDISTPVNHHISTSTKPTFSWDDAEGNGGIAKYQLFIDGNLNMDNISGTSTTLTSGLSEGTYTWYVKAFNGVGNATTSISTRTINIFTGYTPSTTFYVDNVLGNDNNLGTQSSPWATLTKATNTVQAGNTVVIIKNDDIPYRESLSPSTGNTTDGNIVFRAVDASNKPEIWGSDNVSPSVVGGWTLYSEGNINTYQKSTTSAVVVLATGLATSTLNVRNWGSSASSLSEGEWNFSSNVLYYRLNIGEDINTIHIEAGQRGIGIVCSGRNTFQNIIVKYSNVYNARLSVGCIGEGLELYDSGYYGAILSGSGSSVDNPGAILRYSLIAGSYSHGVYLSFTNYARIYNNVLYDNGTGIFVYVFAHNSIVKNNIIANNTDNINFNIFSSITNFVASNNNWYSGTIDSEWANTYKGNNNQASTTPLLIDTSNRNFRLDQLSPNIDTGTSVSGLTTDILGNPIYGTADIGSYEYQPPYTVGTNNIELTGETRIYSDGKYRYTTATTSATTADLTITPLGGSYYTADYSQYMDLTIDTWATTGDQNKQWTATSSVATTTVTTIGDLLASTYYQFKLDGTASSTAVTGSTCNASGACLSDSNGQIVFNYIGGYSTHTFALERDITSPVSFNLSSPADSTNTSSNQPAFFWNDSSDSSSGLSHYQLYVNGSLDTDNISGTSVAMSGSGSLVCGDNTWYVVAVDNDGNTTNTNTRTLKQACGGGIFTGSVKDLPGYIEPRPQTIYSDGTIVYYDETETSIDIPTTEKVVALPVALVSPKIQFLSYLQRGDKNNEVSLLQQILRELGFFAYPENTGYFASITEEAVKRFQKAHNIEQVGVVGPKTRAVLNTFKTTKTIEVSTELSTFSFSRYLTLGTSGEEVIQLQQALRDLGFFTYPENTGYLGSITSKAVSAFQREYGIEPVGVVGPQTRMVLNSI